MKVIEQAKLVNLQGGGCTKYLRRAERAYEDGEDFVGAGYIRQWYDCVGLTPPEYI